MGTRGTEQVNKVLLFLGGLCVGVLFSLPYILMRDQILHAPSWGYLGLFIGCALSNASLFLPTSSTLIVLSASLVLSPPLCVVFGGLGAAAGEQVSYICGRIGLTWMWEKEKHCREERRENRIRKWMNQNSILTVFLFALLPLPVFDVVGLAAGGSRMPWHQYAIAAAAGKILKFALTVGYLRYLLPLYIHLLPEPFQQLYEATRQGLK